MRDYSIYGLQGNPYRIGMVDPLLNPKYVPQIVEVDGFCSLKQVVSYLQKKVVDENKPAFFVVTGKNGTGRTSLANYILVRYCEYRGIDRAKLIVPPRIVENHDDLDIFRTWFAYLYNGIDEKNLKLNKDFSEMLMNEPGKIDRSVMKPRFNLLAKKVNNVLSNAENCAGFGICLENVPNVAIIRSALAVFENVQTVGIFTILDYESTGKDVADMFRRNEAHHQDVLDQVFVELSPLSAPDISTLVLACWNGTQPSPFDPAETGRILGKKPRPMAYVLRVLEKTLDTKLIHVQSGLSWPHDENLRITIEQLEDTIDNLGG